MRPGRRKQKRKRSKWVWAKYKILRTLDLKLRALAKTRKISTSRLFRELIENEIDAVEAERKP